MNFERALRAAQGYSELGMWNSSLEELDSIPQEYQQRLDVLQSRLYNLMQTRNWAAAIETAKILCQVDPDATLGYIHAAFCLHELGRTRDALEFLLSGPASLMQDATYHYNVACYHSVLGDPEKAADSLRICFKMDPNFKAYAKGDPDLSPLRGILI